MADKKEQDEIVAHTEDANLPPQFRKAGKTRTFAGRFYDVLDVEDPYV